MASRKVVSDMIMYFSKIYGKTIESDVEEGYYKALKKYPEIPLREAGYQCLEDLNWFPKPAEIIKRISLKEPTSSNENFIISPERTCIECGVVRTCIKEPKSTGQWTCRQCYTGLTPEEHTKKVQEILRTAFG